MTETETEITRLEPSRTSLANAEREKHANTQSAPEWVCAACGSRIQDAGEEERCGAKVQETGNRSACAKKETERRAEANSFGKRTGSERGAQEEAGAIASARAVDVAVAQRIANKAKSQKDYSN